LRYCKDVDNERMLSEGAEQVCIDEYSFELSFIPDGRYGTVKERDSKKQLIKKFKDLKSLYEYFYKNFDKITKPRSLAEK
jgi:hypothetical protein